MRNFTCNMFPLWLSCLFLYILPFGIFQELGTSIGRKGLGFGGVDAVTVPNVVEHNDYVIVKTHESGTFVGTKSYVEIKSEKMYSKKVHKGSNSSYSTFSNRKLYYSFKGIPYAKPPLGPLRWKEPQILDIKDAGPKSATKYGSICSQWDSGKQRPVGSQDCLYLNIFTPRLHVSMKPGPDVNVNYSKYDDDPRLRLAPHLPVLLYVHDGDFISGSGNLPESAESALTGRQDIVLVTFNYRLGVFGFLSSDCKALPGNYGILDQIFVLKWLHKNIHRFGGNSNRITVFGNTLFLKLSPLSKDLTANYILMQSTTTLSCNSESLLNREPKNYFRKVAQASNCPIPDGIANNNANNSDNANPELEDLINDCLRNVPPDQLIQIQQSFQTFWKYPKYLTPTIDEGLWEFSDVLPETVLPQISSLGFIQENATTTSLVDDKGNANPIKPMLMGVSAGGEGLEMVYEFYRDLAREKVTTFDEDVLKPRLKKCLGHLIGVERVNAGKVFEGIWGYYFGSINLQDVESVDNLGADINSPSNLFYKQLLQLFGDATVYAPYWKLLENLRQLDLPSLKLFNYVFDPDEIQDFYEYLQSRLSLEEELMPEEDQSSQNRYSLDEEYYLFRATEDSFRNETETGNGNKTKEIEMSEILTKIWVSFAAYENPKNALKKYGSWGKWTKFGYDYNRLNQTVYYHIKDNVSQMKDNFKKKEAQFWLETVPHFQLNQSVQQLEDWPTLFWIFISLTSILFFIVLLIIAYVIRTKYVESFKY